MNNAKQDADQETSARRIIDRLKMFNRKERDHLMKFALCEKPEAPEISNNLWASISRENGTKPPHPDNMFMGMDYHLNWLHAALATADLEDEGLRADLPNAWWEETQLEGKDKNFRPIQDNQEDVDLLVAWVDSRWSKPLRLVLIEAKLDSSWESAQIKSKRERLTLMRKDANDRGLHFIEWKFLLMSPGRRPTKNEFGSRNFEAPHHWLLSSADKEGNGALWHEELPVNIDLRRVKRKNEKGAKWTTERVERKRKKKTGQVEKL